LALLIVILVSVVFQYGLMLTALIGCVKGFRTAGTAGAWAGFIRGAPWFVWPWITVWTTHALLGHVMHDEDIRQGWRVSLVLAGGLGAALLVEELSEGGGAIGVPDHLPPCPARAEQGTSGVGVTCLALFGPAKQREWRLLS
jgi:hypothetical protein